jgi:uncharacterized membrane protein YdbT with pleckstrin-like domain
VELHPGEVVVFEGHPSWRAVLSFYIGGFAVAVIVGVIVALAASIPLGVVAGVVLFALVIVVGLIRRWATDYMVSNQRLYIRRGIFAKHVQQTRVDRIQNVNTDQRFRDRILRVGTVDFDTAGTGDSDFKFRGVNEPEEVVAAIDLAKKQAATSLG